MTENGSTPQEIQEFNVPQMKLGEIAQALLMMSSAARNISSGATAIAPLSDHPEVTIDLNEIIDDAKNIEKLTTRLYRDIARKAFGAQSEN